MMVTPQILQEQIALLEQKEAEFLALANQAHGAIQALRDVIARIAEPNPEEDGPHIAKSGD